MGVLLQNEAISILFLFFLFFIFLILKSLILTCVSILKKVYIAENLGCPLKIEYLTTLFLKGFGPLFQISYGTS